MGGVERDPGKARAWRARSKPLDRAGRLTVNASRYDPARRQRGSTLRERSPDLDVYYRMVRAPLVARLLAARRALACACEAPALFVLAGVDDPVAGCAPFLDVHERRRRAQTGSLECAANLLVLCRAHHDEAGVAGRGSCYHQAGIVMFAGDDGYEALGARRGERKQRP